MRKHPGARQPLEKVVIAMIKSTCKIDECESPVEARGWCGRHYKRWQNTGSAERPCKTCGQEITGFGPSTYCSEECRPECSFSDCKRPCDGASDLCVIHRGGVYKYGRLPTYEWAKERKCIVCGDIAHEKGYRKTCSGKCKQLLSRNGGVPPLMIKQCVKCTGFIDLTITGKSGRKKRADTKFCEPCKKSRVLPHQMSVTELADRDGTQCGICSTNVDMTLVFPNTMRASVDHIQPVACGGTNDPENLQLAHLHCNFIKSSRDGFTLEASPKQ